MRVLPHWDSLVCRVFIKDCDGISTLRRGRSSRDVQRRSSAVIQSKQSQEAESGDVEAGTKAETASKEMSCIGLNWVSFYALYTISHWMLATLSIAWLCTEAKAVSERAAAVDSLPSAWKTKRSSQRYERWNISESITVGVREEERLRLISTLTVWKKDSREIQ